MGNRNGGIKLNMQTKSMISKLGKRGNRLQIIAAETVNESAESLDKQYVKNLKKNQRLRNERFTLGAIKTFKANPIRKSGEPRRLENINAVTGVRKMKGGKKHYLAKLEDKDRARANPKTMNRVPVPLKGARAGKNINKAVSSPNRLLKGETQKLKIRGKIIGIKRDGFKSTSQRFGALYGAKKKKTIQGNIRKPFYFIDGSGDLGIFKFIGNKAIRIRSLKKSTKRIKGEQNFKKAFKATTPASIKKDFVKKAQQELKGLV